MTLQVKTRPNSKEESVEMIGERHYKISVKEPPIDGRANRALVRALAKHFNIAEASVRIVSGALSKNKLVEIL